MDASSSLSHRPEGPWAFDETVTACFEDMLRRSIPDYETMRQTVTRLAGRYVRPETAVVDLGCSRGDAIAPLIERFGAHNVFVGVESAEPMYAACRERFRGWIDCGVVRIQHKDLRDYYPPVRASATLAVLSLQFVPIEHRQRVVRRCFASTVPGGCLVLVEKVLGRTAEIQETLVDLYHQLKAAGGYSPEAIETKRRSLEGVLVPVTARWNEEMLADAGFSQVDCVWRCMNFAAWIAVRDGP